MKKNTFKFAGRQGVECGVARARRYFVITLIEHAEESTLLRS